MVSCFFLFFLLAISSLKANTINGQFKPVCTRISLLNPSEVLLKWIPPIMPDKEIPRYQVIYVSNGVGIVERTLESSLTIPLEPNASHVNAIVRTIMPSDAGRDERHKGLNECQFHLNLTDKRPIFHHLTINPGTINTDALGNISLHPVAPNMAELTWQHLDWLDPSVHKYKIIYTYGKEALSVNVTGLSKFNLPIRDGAMGIEAQVTVIGGQDSEDLEILSSQPVFLELSEDGPNIPIYVTLSRKSRDRAMLSWLPPRTDDLKYRRYEVLYNFDNDNELNIRQTEQTEEAIEIPEETSILKAAVGIVPEQVEDSDAKQVPTVYSSFKYLDLREFKELDYLHLDYEVQAV